MVDAFLALPPLAQAVIAFGLFVVGLSILMMGAEFLDHGRKPKADVEPDLGWDAHRPERQAKVLKMNRKPTRGSL